MYQEQPIYMKGSPSYYQQGPMSPSYEYYHQQQAATPTRGGAGYYQSAPPYMAGGYHSSSYGQESVPISEF